MLWHASFVVIFHAVVILVVLGRRHCFWCALQKIFPTISFHSYSTEYRYFAIINELICHLAAWQGGDEQLNCVPRIFGIIVLQNAALILMEDGGEDLQKLHRSRNLNSVSLLECAPEIVSAVRQCHRAGVIHCDIRPENFILNREGHIRLIDFGLATPFPKRGQKVKHSLATGCVGTLPYIAPELFVALADYESAYYCYTQACDKWSLGVMFVVLSCGENDLMRSLTEYCCSRVITEAKLREGLDAAEREHQEDIVRADAAWNDDKQSDRGRLAYKFAKELRARGALVAGVRDALVVDAERRKMPAFGKVPMDPRIF